MLAFALPDLGKCRGQSPMIELDPEDRLQRFSESRSPSFTKIMVSMIVAVLFGGGFLYWYYQSQRPNYSHVYASLGIASLPPTVELQPQIQNRLDQLSREPCYRAAIYSLADALLEAGSARGCCTAVGTSLRSVQRILKAHRRRPDWP